MFTATVIAFVCCLLYRLVFIVLIIDVFNAK